MSTEKLDALIVRNLSDLDASPSVSRLKFRFVSARRSMRLPRLGPKNILGRESSVSTKKSFGSLRPNGNFQIPKATMNGRAPLCSVTNLDVSGTGMWIIFGSPDFVELAAGRSAFVGTTVFGHSAQASQNGRDSLRHIYTASG